MVLMRGHRSGFRLWRTEDTGVVETGVRNG